MFSRITFALITSFWLLMSYLLWRSEYVGPNQIGSSIPVQLVWRKILTAPDNSSLEIMHNGRKVGYCRWASSISQELETDKFLNNDAAAPTPPPQTLPDTNYRLDLEGNVTLEQMEVPSRLRFDSEFRLTKKNDWQEFHVRLNLRPSVWEIRSVAKEQTIHFIIDDKMGRIDRTIKFADLQNPTALAEEFEVPIPLGMLGALAPFGHGQGDTSLSLGLQWKARNDWISIGHTSVRAFRLEATILERYRMMIIVSRVGEILRVELPDNWELINDQLISL